MNFALIFTPAQNEAFRLGRLFLNNHRMYRKWAVSREKKLATISLILIINRSGLMNADNRKGMSNNHKVQVLTKLLGTIPLLAGKSADVLKTFRKITKAMHK